MKYVLNPNLPKNKVKIAIIDCKAGEIRDELLRLGVQTVPTINITNINVSISSHPDMQICHIGGNKFYTMNNVGIYYKNKISELGSQELCELFNNVYSYENCDALMEYPNDCKLNSAVTDRWVITHKDNLIYDSLNINIIRTRQGYAKCSTCIVADDAIITADPSIEKSARNFGIDVCIVTNNSIGLQGYKNGFIGGTCGKISENVLVFLGNIKTHPDADKIISFCRNHGVECISMGNDCLYDYGSLLPIIEE